MYQRAEKRSGDCRKKLQHVALHVAGDATGQTQTLELPEDESGFEHEAYRRHGYPRLKDGGFVSQDS